MEGVYANQQRSKDFRTRIDAVPIPVGCFLPAEQQGNKDGLSVPGLVPDRDSAAIAPNYNIRQRRSWADSHWKLQRS
jgi:hypothetical protein